MQLRHYFEGADHVVEHESGIILRFRRVREYHDEVTALATISLRGFVGQPDGDVFDGKLILTGPHSKRDAAAQCEKLAPGVADWIILIEAAQKLVRRALEEGEPIYDLADGFDSEDGEDNAPYLVAPFIQSQEHTVLFGKGGSGKSTIALALALIYTEGTRHLNLEVGGKGRVLYLDYEDSRGNMKRRLRALASGLGIVAGPPSVYYKRASASLTNMADELGRQISRNNIDGLIVDSAALACGADPEKAESAIGYFNALRALRVKWSLTIAHQSKMMSEKEPMPFGSVFWWNSPRIIWQSRAARPDGQADLHIGLWNHKNNNDQQSPPLGFHLSFDNGYVRLQPEAPRRVDDFREHVTNRERILAVLEDADEPMAYEQLATATGIKDSILRTTMSRLGNQVMKDGSGFRLVTPARF